MGVVTQHSKQLVDCLGRLVFGINFKQPIFATKMKQTVCLADLSSNSATAEHKFLLNKNIK